MDYTKHQNYEKPTAEGASLSESQNANSDKGDVGRTVRVVFGETIAKWDWCYIKDSDGKAYKAKADAIGTAFAVGCAMAAYVLDDVGWLAARSAIVQDVGWTWAEDTPIYLSSATAGAMSQTPGTIPIMVALPNETDEMLVVSPVGMTIGFDGKLLANLQTDAKNISTDTTTGTKHGTAVDQKWGIWNTTPIVQPASGDQTIVTLGNTDNEIGGLTISDPPTQAEVQVFRDKCEELADDVRALSTLIHAMRVAMVNYGSMKGSA